MIDDDCPKNPLASREIISGLHCMLQIVVQLMAGPQSPTYITVMPLHETVNTQQGSPLITVHRQYCLDYLVYGFHLQRVSFKS